MTNADSAKYTSLVSIPLDFVNTNIRFF